MWNAGLDESQARIKIARENIKTKQNKKKHLRYANDTSLMAESEVELKKPLMKMKEESEKNWLKTQHSKTKLMASGPITSRQMGTK